MRRSLSFGCMLALTVVLGGAIPAWAAQPSTTTTLGREQSPTSHPLVLEYAVLLARLPLEEPASVTSATLAWHRAFDAQPVPLRDAAFRHFHAWHATAIEKLFEAVDAEARDQPVDAHALSAPSPESERDWMTEGLAESAAYERIIARPAYAAAGLRVYWTEGDPYAATAPLYFIGEFGALLGPGLRAYLELESEEFRQPPASDAAMVLELTEWAERLARWEAYARDYPNEPEAARARQQARWYRNWLLLGMSNTPLWDGDERKGPLELNGDFRRAYVSFLLRHPGLPSAEPIGAFYKLLTKQGFRRPADAKLDAFYKRYDVTLE